MSKAARFALLLVLLIAPGFYIGYSAEAHKLNFRDAWLLWIIPYVSGVAGVAMAGRIVKIIVCCALLLFGIWMLVLLFAGI